VNPATAFTIVSVSFIPTLNASNVVSAIPALRNA
jgi:hypothetical protein